MNDLLKNFRCCAAALAFGAVVAGCAVIPREAASPAVVYATDDFSRRCAEFLHAIDVAVAGAVVADGMAARVADFPHLRVNRLLASYAQEARSEAQFRDWIRRLAELGVQAYRMETDNLPAVNSAALQAKLKLLRPEPLDLAAGVAECTSRLAAADLAQHARREELRRAAQVPDDYATWQRVAGLYWITRVPFSAGVRRWQEEMQAVFERPLFMLPVYGERVRYEPPPGSSDLPAVAAILDRASANPLGVPDPRGADLDALFAAFAPEFIIDTVSDADRIGALGWFGAEAPTVDIAHPVVYRRVSHTRYRGRALLQLNYSIWFPARPLVSDWDLFGGHLDGLTWRVTLTPEGDPWIYDSIHNCGCYHQFFPTARALLRPLPETLDEVAFMPQRLAAVAPGERISLRLEHGTHYLQRVIIGHAAGVAGVYYRFTDDDELRSRPVEGGARRSVFRPDGIVPGSERGERYWFWPMGVPEPGAMRQWGRHATAFVGRRHFDDADLLEKYFEMTRP